MIVAILKGVRWYLTKILICVFSMITDVNHLFIYLLSVYLTSLKKMSIQILYPFFNLILSFQYRIVWVSRMFWILTPYVIYDLQIFSSVFQVAFSFCWLFPLLCRNLLVWCGPTYLFEFLLPELWVSNLDNPCQDWHQAYTLCFPWSYFIRRR